jgi:hypothetical protein
MDTRRKDRRWLQWVLGAAGILMGVAAASLMFGHRAQTPLPAPHQTAPTALYVQHDGGALRLHWDPAVRANSRIIWIQDGPRETRLDLNADELRSGVASYWPESREVIFRLQLDGGPAGTIQAPAEAPPAVKTAEKPRPRRPAAKPVKVASADRVVDGDDDDQPVKRSRFSRVTGKIPLLRRLRKH